MEHPTTPHYIVFILHAFTANPGRYRHVSRVINQTYPDATIVIPKLGMTFFSLQDPDEIVVDILKRIDEEWDKLSEEDKLGTKIILIGHSTGTLLARKAYVIACGENENAQFEDCYRNSVKPKAWAAHVERIILLAGINRGWTIHEHLYTLTGIGLKVGYGIGLLMTMFRIIPFAFKTRRGSSFVTQLRLQWLELYNNTQQKGLGEASVIQLLGSVDDIVPPEDNIDIVTGSNFFYLDVPQTGHMNIRILDDSIGGRARTKVFLDALIGSKSELADLSVLPTEEGNFVVNKCVEDVVFVIHGIRDDGYWTQKLARRVKTAGDKEFGDGKFATETSTYGYFSMLSFVLPFIRRQKVEWFMDQYTENKARYPNAAFSFIGHSNGTYLLAKALKDYPICRFKHVILAGSVVPSHFNWKAIIEQKRIEKFYNLVCSSDWVVAIFPKFFETLKLQDLGSGGFDGFRETKSLEVKFIPGYHSSAIKEHYWNHLAHFIVHGKTLPFEGKLSTPIRSNFMKYLGASSPLPFFIILVFCIGVGLLINYFVTDVIQKMVTLAVYLLVIWFAVTKI